MNNKITDVIIHTSNHLSDQQFADISKQVYQNEGIVSVSRNVHTPKFLMVVYDAGRTQAKSILKTVTSLGYPATLVGI